MKHPKLAVIAAALWAGGFAGSAALAYSVNRPLHVTPTTDVVRQAPDPPPAVLTPVAPMAPIEPAAEAEHHFVMPTVEIVSHIAKPVRAQTTAQQPPHQRDISEMKCSAWRPLEQGSNSVQICE